MIDSVLLIQCSEPDQFFYPQTELVFHSFMLMLYLWNIGMNKLALDMSANYWVNLSFKWTESVCTLMGKPLETFYKWLLGCTCKKSAVEPLCKTLAQKMKVSVNWSILKFPKWLKLYFGRLFVRTKNSIWETIFWFLIAVSNP